VRALSALSHLECDSIFVAAILSLFFDSGEIESNRPAPFLSERLDPGELNRSFFPSQLIQVGWQHCRLWCLPLEGVNVLGADVTQRQRRVIRGPTDPTAKDTACSPQILNAYYPLDLMVANPYSE
jgi:hypothetical protein